MMTWQVGTPAIMILTYKQLPFRVAIPVKIVEVTDDAVTVLPHMAEELNKEADNFLRMMGTMLYKQRRVFDHAGNPTKENPFVLQSFLAMLP
jgi:hypothetical protein